MTTSLPPRPAERQRTARGRLATDRVARFLVTAGGLGIIASILGILIFIVIEVFPLTTAAEVTLGPRLEAPTSEFAAFAVDEYKSLAAGLTRDGVLREVDLADGKTLSEAPLFAGQNTPVTGVAASPTGRHLAAATGDGRVLIVPTDWSVTFEGESRRVKARFGTPSAFTLDPAGRPVQLFAFGVASDGRESVAAVLADGTLSLVLRTATQNLITGEVTESFESLALTAPKRPAQLLLDSDQRHLYGGTEAGEILWWDLGAGVREAAVVSAAPGAITALTLLIGDRSLVVGQADGKLSVWFPVSRADGPPKLTRIRTFPPLPGAVRLLAPSMRNKGFLAAGERAAGLYYSTSERVVWTGPSPLPSATAVALAPRADGAVLTDGKTLARLELDNPHPEVSWTALFGKVWYEGYEKPEYVWQSTGGTDDFESKLSLTPLLVGTLKGTFYSLLLAIPLGVLGAMYTSQFLHPTYQRYVKPTVEIMAALPTVVLGFLAGLWLAPRLEKVFPALLLMLVLLPLLVLGAGALWHRVPRRIRGRFLSGTEALLFIFVVAFGMWLSVELSLPVERLFFGGNFQAWLLDATGLGYDQRNAVVVGLAMGFAVIPIIFAISEDAFSNVPKNLVSGALALGANRWQTVTRVVLPTASPGIFSAIMVGFGRAVGETMIVLMATGNTPIMDWSPFNGFRTLSANIAVEIPEAPIGSTLYRTLFLAALLLFALTFTVNTVAEVIRQRLRRRYAQL